MTQTGECGEDGASRQTPAPEHLDDMPAETTKKSSVAPSPAEQVLIEGAINSPEV